jgi:hypothetical protein
MRWLRTVMNKKANKNVKQLNLKVKNTTSLTAL